MKYYFKIGIILIIASLLYIACKKETPHVAATTSDFTNTATVQIFNATVNAARNFVYVDGAAVSGNALPYSGLFPSLAFGIKVPAGSRTVLVKDTTSTTSQIPVSITQTFDAGKSYTIFMYDTTTSAKQKTVINTIIIPTDTSSRLRFANLLYSTTALANVDVYSFRRGGVGGTATAALFTNVPTGGSTDFIPFSSGTTDTLYLYATGTTSPLLFKGLVNSLTPTRSYTTAFIGSNRTPTTTAKAFNTFANY